MIKRPRRRSRTSLHPQRRNRPWCLARMTWWPPIFVRHPATANPLRAEKPPPHRRTRQQLKKEDHGTYEKKSAGQEQMCSSPALQCDGPWQGEIANGKRRSHDCNKSSPSRLQRPSATSTRQSPQNMEGFGSWLITQLCRSSQMRTLQTVILPSP